MKWHHELPSEENCYCIACVVSHITDNKIIERGDILEVKGRLLFLADSQEYYEMHEILCWTTEDQILKEAELFLESIT